MPIYKMLGVLTLRQSRVDSTAESFYVLQIRYLLGIYFVQFF
jgi:hypothetical protein